jgi:uncharacterized membrane protein
MASTPTANKATSRDIETEDYPLPINPPARRLESIDLLRGLLMLLMALDHVRDFFSSAVTINPTGPTHSWPALFATRWVTHLCAPGFVALAGASVYLQKVRGKSSGQVGKLLLTRGLWLIFLELTLIDFGWFFGLFPFLQVIWVIGASMVLLSALQRLPAAVVGSVGAAILLLHNLLDPIQASSFGRAADLWDIVHVTSMLMYHGHPIGFAFYPVLPWFGIMCVGYAFGQIAAEAPRARQRAATLLGVLFLAFFSVLRFLGRHGGGYGDSYHWHRLATPAQTAMSFLQVEKYPPSLQYALATFGVLLLLYAAFDKAATGNWLPPLRRFIEVYGRVPFFYYVLHLYLIHGSAVLLTLARHQDWRLMIGPAALLGGNRPDGWGFALPGVYCIWLGVILVLYLPCLWFSRLKGRRHDWWLSYL